MNSELQPLWSMAPPPPVLSAFQRSTSRRSRLSGVPIGPKLEKGRVPWLWVGGEEGRLLGLDEWGDWLAGVEWSVDQNGVRTGWCLVVGCRLWVQDRRTWAGRQGGGPRSSFKQRIEWRLLVHHGSIGLGAGWLGLPVGLTEDAVLVKLLHTRQTVD